ncbi:hypothetical protein [Bacillus amyloliquefaciens]|uniref:hypothetical protein n=1 Tax=Bacillus amyloliquefaciens TaxID=1390 RepID=UPI0020A09F85|nr:hypothetical protein [Bacillus amyloliquefaciens]MCP1459079.1 hypothetical protein [Bacillus amyloliquefaciens]
MIIQDYKSLDIDFNTGKTVSIPCEKVNYFEAVDLLETIGAVSSGIIARKHSCKNLHLILDNEEKYRNLFKDEVDSISIKDEPGRVIMTIYPPFEDDGEGKNKLSEVNMEAYIIGVYIG